MLEALICPQCGAPLDTSAKCSYCGVRFKPGDDMAGQIVRWNGIGSIDESGNVTPWYKVLGAESTPGLGNSCNRQTPGRDGRLSGLRRRSKDLRCCREFARSSWMNPQLGDAARASAGRTHLVQCYRMRGDFLGVRCSKCLDSLMNSLGAACCTRPPPKRSLHTWQSPVELPMQGSIPPPTVSPWAIMCL